jgi:hypothetical protein
MDGAQASLDDSKRAPTVYSCYCGGIKRCQVKHGILVMVNGPGVGGSAGRRHKTRIEWNRLILQLQTSRMSMQS